MPPETDKLEPPPPPHVESTAEPGVKWCEYGQHFLPADTENFGANRASEDGLSTWCREHSREHDRTRSKDHLTSADVSGFPLAKRTLRRSRNV